MVQVNVVAREKSVRQALESADLSSLAEHCARDPGRVVRGCIAWQQELTASQRHHLARWASVAGQVAGLLRSAGELSHALELLRAGGRVTLRLRAEEALAALANGDHSLARELVEGDEPLARALRPIVGALSGGSVLLRGAPKAPALAQLWAAAKTVRELSAGRLAAARRAAASTGDAWFAGITEHALYAREGRLLSRIALERLQALPKPPSQSQPQPKRPPQPGQAATGAKHAQRRHSDSLATAFISDLLWYAPELTIDISSLRRIASQTVFRYWFDAKLRALGKDPAALTRWIRGVSPEQVPPSLGATYYLWRSFLRIASQRGSAKKDIEAAARLGADPVEVARAAFLLALQVEADSSKLERATDTLAQTLARAGGEQEAAVVRAQVLTAEPKGLSPGSSPAMVRRLLTQARDAAQRLGEDRASVEYKLDCLEAVANASSEPERAWALAARAADAFPQRIEAWEVQVSLASIPGSTCPRTPEQLLEAAHAATGAPEFLDRARRLRLSSGRVEPFAELSFERVEASTLIGEAFRYLVDGSVSDSEPQSFERWQSAWRRVLEHRSELQPKVRDAFDAAVLAYGVRRFGPSKAGRWLVEACAAKPPLSSAVLQGPVDADEGLGQDELMELAQQAADFAATSGSISTPSRHPLCLLVAAQLSLGQQRSATLLIGKLAASVDAAVVRAALKLLEQPPEPPEPDWDELHDSLHPIVCLEELLHDDVDASQVALGYQQGHADDEDAARLRLNTPEEGEADEDGESFDEALSALAEVAKLFRMDMDKVRALSPETLTELLWEIEEIEPGSAEGLAAVRRLAELFGVERAWEAPTMAAPASQQEKNRRKRERRARKGGKKK